MPSPPLSAILGYAALPVAATLVGATAAAIRPPGPRLRSAVQHFAAGVVFSVVAVEVLPDVIRVHDVREVVWGFALGIAMMLGIRRLTSGPEVSPESGRMDGVSAGFLVAIGVDFFLDGLLVGIGFAAGHKEGVLLTLALSVELLSLGLAISTALPADRGRLRAVGIPTALSLLLVVGALAGGTALRHLSDHALAAVLSFGTAALLFLVTEELLVEAHEVPETAATTAMFFVGFLLFLVLGMVG